jgi:hypothetical protein
MTVFAEVAASKLAETLVFAPRTRAKCKNSPSVAPQHLVGEIGGAGVERIAFLNRGPALQ